MKAKKLIYLAIAAIMISSLSCDDILDKKPLNGYSELDIFTDEALLTNYVNGMYIGIRHPFNDENSLTDGLTDNAYNQHGSAESTIKVYTRGEVSENTGEGITRGLWDLAYGYIRRTNMYFEKTVDSPIDADALEKLDGEVHFVRAYLYFDLLRWYGGVPIITSTYGLDDESYDVARNTADEVADFIVEECDLAISQLYSINDGDYEAGRACVEAAMALKARTLLYIASPLFNESNDQNKWIAARDANKAVMDLDASTALDLVSSGDSFGALFRGEVTDEVILARYFSSTNNQGYGVNIWLFPNSAGGWSNTTPTQNLVDSYELTNGLLPSEAGSGYDDQDPYINRDPRFYQTILYNGAPFKEGSYDPYLDIDDPTNSAVAGKDSRYSSTSPWNSSKTGYTFRKWIQEDVGEYSGNMGPWIIFRLGEFYLNYAETQIALGEEGEARDAINTIRGRFGMPDVTESGDELVERYRRERRVELVLEDHRFFDMRRWKIGEEVLDAVAMGVDVYKDGSVFEYHYDLTADNTRKWDDKMYLLPIPASERQRSNNMLTQNPGYTQ